MRDLKKRIAIVHLLGIKKLNELKRVVGQALKDKVFSLKKTKDELGMELIMNAETNLLEKNGRYRIIHMSGEYYILDMEKIQWLLFIPLLLWLTPQKVYKIDSDIAK